MAPRRLIGLTGNIATGKSNVLAELRALGCFIIDADEVARFVQQPGQPALAAILDAFGSGVFKPDGSLDRRALAGVVFEDRARMKQLEGIVHPAIRAEIERRLADTPSDQVAVLEAILLFENHWFERCDQVWVTDCPPTSQVARLVASRGLSEEEAWARVRAQNAQADKVARADVVIDTRGPVEETRAQVRRAYARLMANTGVTGVDAT